MGLSARAGLAAAFCLLGSLASIPVTTEARPGLGQDALSGRTPSSLQLAVSVA